MGALVGALVGELVGALVGELVGALVGFVTALPGLAGMVKIFPTTNTAGSCPIACLLASYMNPQYFASPYTLLEILDSVSPETIS